MRGRSAARRASLVVLTALLGAAVVVGTGSAVASDPGAVAVAAKKKCKKKKGRSAVASKKKKCKKKKGTTVAPPPQSAPAQPSGPTSRQRVSLDWTDDTVDLDLYVWDNSGNESSYFDNGIPNSTNSGNVSPTGPETFTDTLPPFSRAFAVGVCVYDADGSSDPIPFSLTYVDSANVGHTYNIATPNSVPGTRVLGSRNFPSPGAGDPWFGEYNPEDSSPGWCININTP